VDRRLSVFADITRPRWRCGHSHGARAADGWAQVTHALFGCHRPRQVRAMIAHTVQELCRLDVIVQTIAGVTSR